jgi:hypothetical protein
MTSYVSGSFASCARDEQVDELLPHCDWVELGPADEPEKASLRFDAAALELAAVSDDTPAPEVDPDPAAASAGPAAVSDGASAPEAEHVADTAPIAEPVAASQDAAPPERIAVSNGAPVPVAVPGSDPACDRARPDACASSGFCTCCDAERGDRPSERTGLIRSRIGFEAPY